jgi:hypothetical protein
MNNSPLSSPLPPTHHQNLSSPPRSNYPSNTSYFNFSTNSKSKGSANFQYTPIGHQTEKKIPYTTFQKIAYGSLAALGMALGTALTVVGSALGMAVIYRLYLNTSVGLKIFKVFSAICFPIGSGLGFVAGISLVDPWTKIISLITAYASALCFAAPFSPILFGAVGGYPGSQLTIYSYYAFKKIVK